MLVLAVKPGHNGAIAAVKDGRLLFCIESEKDSLPRYVEMTPDSMLRAMEHLDEIPDVVAVSGWNYVGGGVSVTVGSGYLGAHRMHERRMKFLGKDVKLFSSTHERSHIMMSIGMAPRDQSPVRAVLVWEGNLGGFYLVDENWAVTQEIPVLNQPGARYAFVYALADPTFPDRGMGHRWEDAGKVMALAAYGDPENADPAVVDTVERIMGFEPKRLNPLDKYELADTPVYNSGVESQATKDAAALLSRRLFSIYAAAAREHLPPDIPLHISGGCGLNCDWNAMWRDLGYFSSVFVPPCTDDSGSAIGTAIDAVAAETGDPHIEWNVYSGLEFEWDREPDAANWKRQARDDGALADAIADGHVVAWVQGRWELGPRALGNRSLLAEPFDRRTHERLNRVKKREGYRPIAPCCRVEDIGRFFNGDFEDPYMLYFRTVRTDELKAVTHVDGSARVQSVSRETNKPLHDLLSVFNERHGVGVLCNTSLNFKGRGFINRLSHLTDYCEMQGVNDMVVGDTWFTRNDGEARPVGEAAAPPTAAASPYGVGITE